MKHWRGFDPGAVASIQAVIRRVLTWLGVDDRTGRVIAELPDMRGEPSRLLTAHDSSKLTYPLTETGPGGLPTDLVLQATRPSQTTIVLVANDVPMWSGRVLKRVGGSSADLILGCATPEQALVGTQVGSVEFVGRDRALVARDLVLATMSNPLGSGFPFRVETTLTGDVIDQEYLDSDLTDTYNALRALASGGLLEWTVDTRWTTSAMNQVEWVMTIGPRIGRAGFDGAAVFETLGEGGVEYELDEDYTTGRYANVVTVYGDGEGEDLPRVTVADAAVLATGVPIVHRALHARDTTDTARLLEIADGELQRLKHGAELWSLTSNTNAYPRPGFHVGLGDDTKFDVIGPRHPDGHSGRGRVIGYVLDPARGRWTPRVWDPQDQEVT